MVRSAPFVAVAGGAVTKATAFAAPAVSAKLPDVTVRVPSENCSVNAPAVPASDRPANVATPPTAATVGVPLSVPVPLATVAVTFEVAVVRFPCASSSCTLGCVPNAMPFTAPAGCVSMVSCATAPGASTTLPEFPTMPPAIANWSVNVPAVPVRRRFVNVATPATADTVVVPLSVAPDPPPIDTVTAAVEAVRFPSASLSWITGCPVKSTPLAAPEGCVSTETAATAPAPTLTLADVTGVRAPLVNCRVRAPATPVILRSPNVATPLTVTAVSVPPSVTPPLARAAVTVTPDVDTALPLTSSNRTAGCVPNTEPLATAGDGCVTIASWVAAPAASVTVPVVTVRVPSENCSVNAPAVPFRRNVVNVATPAVIVAVAPASDPPVPVAIVAVIVPEAAVAVFPLASSTRTTGWVARSTPFVAEADGAVVNATALGTPGVSATILELPVTDTALNCSVKFPTVPVSRRLVNVAVPFTADTVVVPLSVAPDPLPIATVTAAVDAVTFPSTSLSWITGCARKSAPAAAPPGCVSTNTDATAPDDSVIVPDVMVRVPSENWSVNAPAVPFRRSDVNVATPAVIVAVAPTSEPPVPDAIVAVMVPLAAVTVLPCASTTRTTGCVARFTPLVAVATGADTNATALAAPGVKVTVCVDVANAAPGAEPSKPVIVAVPDTVELIVVENTPEAVVVPVAAPKVPTPMRDKLTTSPAVARLFPWASLSWIVTVLVVPLAVTDAGDTDRVDVAVDAGPGRKTTVTGPGIAIPPSAALIVAVPATVDVTVAVYVPFPPATGLSAPTPVSDIVTGSVPLVMLLLFASRSWTVITEPVTPSAVTFVTLRDSSDVLAFDTPASTVTPTVTSSPSTVAVIDVVPLATPVTRPAADTVATAGLADTHVTGSLGMSAPRSLNAWSVSVAVRVAPLITTLAGDTT